MKQLLVPVSILVAIVVFATACGGDDDQAAGRGFCDQLRAAPAPVDGAAPPEAMVDHLRALIGAAPDDMPSDLQSAIQGTIDGLQLSLADPPATDAESAERLAQIVAAGDRRVNFDGVAGDAWLRSTCPGIGDAEFAGTGLPWTFVLGFDSAQFDDGSMTFENRTDQPPFPITPTEGGDG